MKKLLTFFLIVIALLLAGVFYVSTHISGIVSQVASTILGVPVTLNAATLTKEGLIRIEGFHIPNPSGFTKNGAIDVGSLEVQMDPDAFFKTGLLDFKTVELKQPVIRSELNLQYGSNLNVLAQNLKATFKKPAAEPAAPTNNAVVTESERKVIIRHFKLDSSKLLISSGADLKGQVALDIPGFELRDIGVKENGIPANRVVYTLLLNISEHAANNNGYLKGLENKLITNIQNFIKQQQEKKAK